MYVFVVYTTHRTTEATTTKGTQQDNSQSYTQHIQLTQMSTEAVEASKERMKKTVTNAGKKLNEKNQQMNVIRIWRMNIYE